MFTDIENLSSGLVSYSLNIGIPAEKLSTRS